MSDSAYQPDSQAGPTLLAIVRAVAEEQHPHRRGALDVGLDSAFDRDLALDSLARMELLGRVERAFRVELSDDLIGIAESPRDLLQALGEGPSRAARGPTGAHLPAPAAQTGTGLPAAAATLLEVLEWHVATHPGRVHVRFLAGDDDVQELTYASLRRGALEAAAALRAAGVAPGETVAIMLPTCLGFFFSYFGIQLAGAIPVPIYPPARIQQIEDHLLRHAAILENAGAVVLVTVPEALGAARFLRARAPSVRSVIAVGDLRADPTGLVWPAVGASDLAFLQYTSGSTGNPKGVMLTHANLLANLRAMGQPFGLNAAGDDVFVSWLPLYHDMGLIGAWLGSLYFAMPLAVMSPLRFLARPERWLRAMHEHRGTISASPNFGYELCRARIRDDALGGLDLSSWRIAANGAEAVLPSTLRGFSDRFSAWGFRSTALRPVYGLAESSVGLAFPAAEREPRIERVDRATFGRTGAAEPSPADDATALEFVACGTPIPGHEIRIVDEAGREVPERREGAIEFRGPSATRGYYRNAEATRALFHGDWLRTGDRGYLTGGEIVLTGREKDTIIRAGRNLYAAEIETAAGAVGGVRAGCVAAFGATRKAGGTEALVVMAETRLAGDSERAALEHAIQAAVAARTGESPDHVVLVPPYTVPKTSSGKIRRNAARALYERGEHDGRRPVWLQLARLAASAVVPGVRLGARRAGEAAYAAWWWLCAALLAMAAWPPVSLVPSSRFANAWLRMLGRAFFAAVGAPLRVAAPERMPRSGPVVVVCNHTSLLDGLVLLALLPRPARFVAKNTLAGSAWTGPFLRHLGCLFVERFDAERSVRSTGGIAAAVQGGDAVLFFPEGTFGRMPGVLPFRSGAFVVAAEAGASVVPAAVHGARAMLRAGSWFPRRAHLSLAFGESVAPDGAGWEAALRLRDAARAEVLRCAGEPDLRAETGEVDKLRPGARPD